MMAWAEPATTGTTTSCQALSTSAQPQLRRGRRRLSLLRSRDLAYPRHGKQIGLQIYGIVVQAGWAAFSSFILLKIIDKTMGLRVDIRDEVEGLDASVHGETVFYGSEDMAQPPVQGELEMTAPATA